MFISSLTSGKMAKLKRYHDHFLHEAMAKTKLIPPPKFYEYDPIEFSHHVFDLNFIEHSVNESCNVFMNPTRVGLTQLE
jgi:hypothetical protein